jgi:hypothetical protein
MEEKETNPEVIRYSYLIRRAIKVSIEYTIILICLFFLPEIIGFFKFLYGF